MEWLIGLANAIILGMVVGGIFDTIFKPEKSKEK